MSLPKLALRTFLAWPTREFSAPDIAATLPTQPANPRAVLAALKKGGLIEPAGRAGRETLYRLTPGAAPPQDGRIGNIARARRTRQKRTAAAQARAIRTLQRLQLATAVKKARRVRKVRA